MITIRNMTSQMPIFTTATVAPIVLIGLAAVFGGPWVVVAVFYLTVFSALLDRLIQRAAPAQETHPGTGLSVCLSLAHLALLPTVVVALASDVLSTWEKLGLFFAMGLFAGQVSNANAHELIHRSNRTLRRLGMWVYISLLFGHHTSAHLLVHHRYAATQRDPNSARLGEGFYRFYTRAWIGSFRDGYRAEAKRLARLDRPKWRNPYLIYVGGAAAFMLAALSFSPKAFLMYIALAGNAQMQLLLSDYVQHYGLARGTDAVGKFKPVGKAHSWNSPHWFSSAMMLNATRHSDHHTHPARPYPGLRLEQDAPMLPRPLPVMATIALVPPLWRKIMDPAVARVTHA